MKSTLTICDVSFCLDETPNAWRDFAQKHYGQFFDSQARCKVKLIGQPVRDFVSPILERVRARARSTAPFLCDLDLASGMQASLLPDNENHYLCTFQEYLDPKMSLENFIRVFLTHYLPCNETGLMLHGSCGIRDNQGIIFTGVSTAGKTTLSEDFRETLYLSDDISIVEFVENQAFLKPHPFHGKSERLQVKADAPLAAICILGKKSDRTVVRKLKKEEAYQMLPRHIVTYAHSSFVTEKILNVLDRLLLETPVFYIERNLNDVAADELVLDVLEKALPSISSSLKVA